MHAEEVKELAKSIMEMAVINLKKDKYLLPTLFFVCEDGMKLAAVDPKFMKNEATKEALAISIKKKAREWKAEAVFFLSEVWAATYLKENVKKAYIPPAELPERREAIMLTSEYRNGEGIKRTGHMQFFYKAGAGTKEEEIVLGDYEENEPSANSRFTFLEEV